MMYNNIYVQEDLKTIISQKVDFYKLTNKSVLVTGATGMLASYYVYTLMYLNDTYNYDIKIYALVRDKRKFMSLVDVSIRSDVVIIEQDVCEDINIDNHIDYIIHMASSADPNSIVTNPVGIIKANTLGTLKVLDLAKKNNAEVMFASTREVYGEMKEDVEMIKEDDMGVLECLDLRSCYPESKRMSENLIISYAYQYNISYKIARIAHSYGPGMSINNDGRIMSDLIFNVVNKNDIVLKSSGEAKRAFCYIVDAVVALFIMMLDNNLNQVYNVANEKEETSIKDLAYKLEEKYRDRDIKVIFDIQSNTNQYVKFKRVKLDTAKLEKLGWQPITKLLDGIDRTVKYFDSI